MFIQGTKFDDVRNGTAGNDDFHMGQGGNDQVFGLGGGDIFYFGAKFTAADRVDGGDGTDTLVLSGDYHTTVTLANNTLTAVEWIDFVGDNYFDLQFVNANVLAGQTLSISGTGITGGKFMTIDGSAETNGSFIVFGSDGTDIIKTGTRGDAVYGGLANDLIDGNGGHDVLFGGDGNDGFNFAGDGALDPFDVVDGGAGGFDLVGLSGDYSAGLTTNAGTFAGIERFNFSAGYSYTVDFSATDFSDSTTTIFFGDGLGAADVLNISVQQSSGFGFILRGGAGNDILEGSAAAPNRYFAGLGADRMIGGEHDIFVWQTLSDSRGAHYDTIVKFDAHQDILAVSLVLPDHEVDALDPRVTHGTLTRGHFGGDLAAAVGSHELGAGNAVLFKADDGNLAGFWFVIVDCNGVAGYQASADLVFQLLQPLHLADFSLQNFEEPF